MISAANWKYLAARARVQETQRLTGDRDDAAGVPLRSVPHIVATKLLSRSRNGESRLDVYRIATGCQI